jgi:short-subunit dehydrogenase
MSPTTVRYGVGMPLALVTGATAGLGAAFARQLAATGHDLVLVARDAERLATTAAELTAAHGISVEILRADLVEPTDLAAVEARVAETTDPVDVLVNNAGFGLRDPFEKNPVADEQRMIDLLVTAPMRLTHAALGQMLPRRSGTILNVASVAAFTPRGTYGAAKAWVVSFSRSANIEYRRRGVTVTAVAPGFVRTEFHARMDVHTHTIPAPLWLDADRVARDGLRDAARGLAVSIPSRRYKLIVALARILPGRLAAAGTLRPR